MNFQFAVLTCALFAIIAFISIPIVNANVIPNSPKDCPENTQIGHLSGNGCAPNCLNWKKQRLCTKMFALGCDPKPGFAYKEGQSGEVVPVEECQQITI